jgi:hypothetical protein
MPETLADRQREMKSRLHSDQPRRNPEVWSEQHYTVKQLAVLWAMSTETVRRLVQDDPEVMRIGAGESRDKGRYFTYFVPESVARRVHTQACRRR